MANLKFVDTHNMVEFLSKPAESEGFEQIVDFLNAHPIKHALTVNPIIYTSCIEQFWATVKAKTVNGEVQLQALVDGKKIIITESTVRRDIQLEDAEGVDCLPNTTIFEQLTLMGFVQVFLDKQLEGMSNHNRIYITPSHTKKIFGNMRRVGKGFSGRETPLFQTMVVQAQAEIGKGSANPTDPHHTPTFIQPSTSQPQKKQKLRKPKRKDTQIPQSSGPTKHVVDEAVYKELDDSLVRAATTASSLEVEQNSGGGPKRQKTMGDTIAQTRFENVSKLSNDPLLARGNTLQSDEDSLKLKELMELCTNLQTRVLDLEKTKTAQAKEIVSLKKRVKKLEHKKRSRTDGLKRLYKVVRTARVESSRDEESLGEDASKQGRINAIDADEDITLVNDQDDANMFDVNTLTGDEVLAEQEVAAKDVNLTIDEVTLAQALAALKSCWLKECKLKEQERRKKPRDLKNKSFNSIEKMFDRAFKRVNIFVDFRTDLVEGSSKRAGDEMEQEVTKKKKVDDVQETAKVYDDQETAKIKELMEIVHDKEEVAIDAIPLAVKPPSIVDWKIHKEGRKPIAR
ncbi:hypothetical protein Tco_0370128 [Tanacetum coccineum]